LVVHCRGLTDSTVQATAGLFNGQKQLPAASGTSGDVPQTWGAGNLGLGGDGINISTSAIVVMFLHWQLSVRCESKLPWGGGNGKVKDMQGKILAVSEMKTIPGEGKIDERWKGVGQKALSAASAKYRDTASGCISCFTEMLIYSPIIRTRTGRHASIFKTWFSRHRLPETKFPLPFS